METATRLWEMSEKIESLSDEVERLRAREARLREALKHYAEDCDGHCCNKLHKTYQVCGYIARAALKEEKKK